MNLKFEEIDVPIDAIEFYDVKIREVQKDSKEMENLIRSVRTHGIYHRILITNFKDEAGIKVKDRYLGYDGVQRVYAARQAGLASVPCKFVPNLTKEDGAALQLILNTNRIHTKPKEILNHIKIFTFSHPEMTQTEIAEVFCMTPSQLSQFLRLNKLQPKILEMVDRGAIKQSKAIALGSLPEELQVSEIKNAVSMPADQFVNRCKELKDAHRKAKATGEKIQDLVIPHPKNRTDLIDMWDLAKDILEKTDEKAEAFDYNRGCYETLSRVLQVDPETVAAKKASKEADKKVVSLKKAAERKEQAEKLYQEALAAEQERSKEETLVESLA